MIEVVGTAVNGRAGLEKIKEHQPDIVVLDIEMFEMFDKFRKKRVGLDMGKKTLEEMQAVCLSPPVSCLQ